MNILNELTADAAYQSKIAVEKVVLGSVYADALNTVTQIAADKTNIIDWIIDAEVKLEENNAPVDGRWIVIPKRAGGLIQKSDLKRANETGDATSIIRKNMDYLGMVGGMNIYTSNNLASSGGVFQCIAGHKSAITFANQIVKVEDVRLQTKFGNAVRGLNVFGFKTIIPSALVSMPITYA